MEEGCLELLRVLGNCQVFSKNYKKNCIIFREFEFSLYKVIVFDYLFQKIMGYSFEIE